MGGHWISLDRGPPRDGRHSSSSDTAADHFPWDVPVAGRRTNVLDVRELIRRVGLGDGVRRVARDMGVSRKTAAKYLRWASLRGLLAGPLPARRGPESFPAEGRPCRHRRPRHCHPAGIPRQPKIGRKLKSRLSRGSASMYEFSAKFPQSTNTLSVLSVASVWARTGFESRLSTWSPGDRKPKNYRPEWVEGAQWGNRRFSTLSGALPHPPPSEQGRSIQSTRHL